RRHPPPRREPAPVLPGRYPIGAWAFTTDEDRVGPLGAAQAVAAAAQEVVGADDVGAQRILDLMARVVAQTPVYGMWWREPAELASQLCGLANGSST
ncbi:MAG: hypothetical protein QOH10_2872, partial [Actinomycetota bacterium]|nr:hypothetical protein [Actinomycetota bacterium]